MNMCHDVDCEAYTCLYLNEIQFNLIIRPLTILEFSV